MIAGDSSRLASRFLRDLKNSFSIKRGGRTVSAKDADRAIALWVLGRGAARIGAFCADRAGRLVVLRLIGRIKDPTKRIRIPSSSAAWRGDLASLIAAGTIANSRISALNRA